MAMPCSQPMNEDTRQNILFLRSITKVYHQWKHIMNFFFLPHTSLENERKERKTKQISFLTLIAISTHNQISNHFPSSLQQNVDKCFHGWCSWASVQSSGPWWRSPIELSDRGDQQWTMLEGWCNICTVPNLSISTHGCNAWWNKQSC